MIVVGISKTVCLELYVRQFITLCIPCCCPSLSGNQYPIYKKDSYPSYFIFTEYGYSGGGGGGGAYGGYSSYDQAAPAYGGPPSGAPVSGGWGNQGQSAAPYSGYSGGDGPVGGYSTQQGGAGGAPSTAYPSGLLTYNISSFLIFRSTHTILLQEAAVLVIVPMANRQLMEAVVVVGQVMTMQDHMVDQQLMAVIILCPSLFYLANLT